jgi:hypothetical protein
MMLFLLDFCLLMMLFLFINNFLFINDVGVHSFLFIKNWLS